MVILLVQLLVSKTKEKIKIKPLKTILKDKKDFNKSQRLFY